MSKAPRAVRLDPASLDRAHDEVAREGGIAILPESEPIGAVEPAAVPVAKRRWSWGGVFIAGLSGFLTLSIGVWAERTITSLMNESPVLGYAALACAAVAALALLVMLIRVLRDILRERKVEALRLRATAALTEGNLIEAQAVAESLRGLYASRADTAKGRAHL
ncbi:MAG: TIGR01620 family protein, partial [Hyphomicrobiales bacterium]